MPNQMAEALESATTDAVDGVVAEITAAHAKNTGTVDLKPLPASILGPEQKVFVAFGPKNNAKGKGDAPTQHVSYIASPEETTPPGELM